MAGETRNYHAVKSPVFDSAGKVVGTQGVLFDITDRKRAEERLLKVVTQTRCILHSGYVTGPKAGGNRRWPRFPSFTGICRCKMKRRRKRFFRWNWRPAKDTWKPGSAAAIRPIKPR